VGWPAKATPFGDLVRGLRAEGAHAVSDAPNVLDRAAGYVRDDTNELYGFTAPPDWTGIARLHARHRTHPMLLAGSAVAFVNADAAHWSCYAEPGVLDTAEGALQGLAGARVERVRVARDLDEAARRAIEELEAEGS
jgi:hypothetical protein